MYQERSTQNALQIHGCTDSMYVFVKALHAVWRLLELLLFIDLDRNSLRCSALSQSHSCPARLLKSILWMEMIKLPWNITLIFRGSCLRRLSMVLKNLRFIHIALVKTYMLSGPDFCSEIMIVLASSETSFISAVKPGACSQSSSFILDDAFSTSIYWTFNKGTLRQASGSWSQCLGTKSASSVLTLSPILPAASFNKHEDSQIC